MVTQTSERTTKYVLNSPAKPLTIVHGDDVGNSDMKNKPMYKMIVSERASQEEQNGANFSFIAPSSEELGVRNEAIHGL